MTYQILCGDCKKMISSIKSNSVKTCVTSPPYWQLKDYGVSGQVGAEPTPEQYAADLGDIFDEVKRTLRKDGTLWLNLGDVYCGRYNGYTPTAPSNLKGSKQSRGRSTKTAACRMPPGYKAKDLVGAPWLVAMELRRRGWYLRCDIIWDKLGAMPEKVTDRPTRNHEYVFLLSKSERYDCDMSVIAEIMANGKPKNRRAIWRISKQNCPAMHSAVFPDKLAQLCILSGSHTGDTVLDPFMGSGTTGKVAISLDRDFIGIELNPAYCLIAQSKMENY